MIEENNVLHYDLQRDLKLSINCRELQEKVNELYEKYSSNYVHTETSGGYYGWITSNVIKDMMEFFELTEPQSYRDKLLKSMVYEYLNSLVRDMWYSSEEYD